MIVRLAAHKLAPLYLLALFGAGYLAGTFHWHWAATVLELLVSL